MIYELQLVRFDFYSIWSVHLWMNERLQRIKEKMITRLFQCCLQNVFRWCFTIRCNRCHHCCWMCYRCKGCLLDRTRFLLINRSWWILKEEFPIQWKNVHHRRLLEQKNLSILSSCQWNQPNVQMVEAISTIYPYSLQIYQTSRRGKSFFLNAEWFSHRWSKKSTAP